LRAGFYAFKHRAIREVLIRVVQISAPEFDLQAHSTRSDGALEPAAVVAAAAAAGVRLLALTDHDTVDGVEEAMAAGRDHGVDVVPAIEVSAVQGGAAADVHVLGYRVDHASPELGGALEGWQADRALRIERMADRLEELGFELDRTQLEARRAAGEPLGRPHLAAAVRDRPDGFFERYLVAGAPAFVPRTTPSVVEAIAAIHAAGGVAVWAHPFWDVSEPEAVLVTLERFVAHGLDGVEVFYATHTEAQVGLLAERCTRDGLLQTGSADFHGPEHEHFDRFRAFELYGREPVLGPIAPGP
jgi:predicted metal-dependent phosphoesterase TrpH